MYEERSLRKQDDFDRSMLLELLSDAGKNWLAHDGLWFQEVDKRYGIESAIELDKAAWSNFMGIRADA